MSKLLKTPMAIIPKSLVNVIYVSEGNLFNKTKVMATISNPLIDSAGSWSDETLSIHDTLNDAQKALETYYEQLNSV